MSDTNSEQRGLLKDDASMIPPPVAASPASLPQRSMKYRTGYARVHSVSYMDNGAIRHAAEASTNEDNTKAASSNQTQADHGLGISDIPSPPKRPRNSSPLSQTELVSAAEDANKPVLSSPPPLTGSTSYDEFDTSYSAGKHLHNDSRVSLSSTLPPSVYAKSDAGLLSVKHRYQAPEAPHDHQSQRTVRHHRFRHWVSITILVLAIFSTVFSTIFLVIALTGPKYGKAIRRGGPLTPSSAAFLTSMFAKLIELSFVTVVVAFIGQALARRAFKLEKARGVTLAEMSMRSWVMQPGTMLTQWETVRYAGITILGLISLLAATMAILYTSAATALVQPQLRYPPWENRQLQALVKTQFSNPTYIALNCKMPISATYDSSDDRATTCLSMQHASQSYHDYYNYLGVWSDTASRYGNGSSELGQRPQGYAIFTDNTTIAAPWIEIRNVTTPNGTDFIVNNVTMAVPHVGIVQAAIDPINQIMQPSDVEGAEFTIKGSLPSPMVNVLCVTMSEPDLEPFVFSMWNETNSACNQTDWSNWPFCLNYRKGTDQYLNGTALDDVFGWGPQYGANRFPPVFPKLPTDYNSLLNESKGMVTTWGPTSIYLLVKGGEADSVGNPTVNAAGQGTNYAMCELSAGQTPLCYTHYHASSSGGSLSAICETDDPLQYNNSVPNALKGNDTLNKDWPNFASEWARSLSLNDGLFNGNASNARLLGQFVVTAPALSRAMPSTAEAFAVLAGSTLIQSTIDAPTVPFWNYTLPTIADGVHQYFNASLQVQQYASGATVDYQKPFYLVLFIVVIMNVIILVYFLVHKDWYTDFSEPLVLFSLAVNSPPSEKLVGGYGYGPKGDQYRLSWKLYNEDGHYYYVEGPDQTPADALDVESPRLNRRRWTESFEMLTPVNALRSRFSNK